MLPSPTEGRGWYPDPQDPSRLRHWNGRSWSERTTPRDRPDKAGAGWYADPQDASRLRYWNRYRWTKRTRPNLPDIQGLRPSLATFVVPILASIAIALSIPFMYSYDGLPSTDAASVRGFTLWLWAIVVAVVSMFLAVRARRTERDRRSRAGRALSALGYWLSVSALIVWLLNFCAMVGSGL
jgi:Protein of unknown function (DUF2510)